MKDSAPFWFPDAKGFSAIAYFGLAVGLLLMIREDPALLENAAYMGLAGSVMGAGGIGLILSFHYSSSAGAKTANERADKAIEVAANATAKDGK